MLLSLAKHWQGKTLFKSECVEILGASDSHFKVRLRKCAFAWLTIQLLSKLQRVQNAAARMITGAGRSEHITPSLYHLHWLPVECRVKYKILLYTYKALNNTAPVYVCNLLSRHQPGRRLRSTDQCLLSVPRTRTKTYGSRSFKQVAPVLWNALPLDIKTIDSVFNFKRAIKQHLFVSHYGRPQFSCMCDCYLLNFD